MAQWTFRCMNTPATICRICKGNDWEELYRGPIRQGRFDLANFLLWLRDRRPSGLGKVAIEPVLDASFRASLCASGRSDYLYAWMTV